MKKIRIDARFTNREKILILEALNEWEIKTKKLFLFEIATLEAKELHTNWEVPKDSEDFHYQNVYTIIKANSNDRIIKITDYYYKNTIYGIAYGLYFPFIFVVTDRLKTDKIFKVLIMHEIGHLLGLDHSYNKKAIMYKWLYPHHYQITKIDVKALFSLYTYFIINSVKKVKKKLS